MKICYPDWWLEYYGPEDLSDDDPDLIEEEEDAYFYDDEDEDEFELLEDEY